MTHMYKRLSDEDQQEVNKHWSCYDLLCQLKSTNVLLYLFVTHLLINAWISKPFRMITVLCNINIVLSSDMW